MNIDEFNKKVLNIPTKSQLLNEDYEIISLKTIDAIFDTNNITLTCKCGHQVCMPSSVIISFKNIKHMVFKCEKCNGFLTIYLTEGKNQLTKVEQIGGREKK